MLLRRAGFVLAWVVAASAATGIVFAAVTSATGSVVDRPGPTLDAAVSSLEVEEVPRAVDLVTSSTHDTSSTGTPSSPVGSSPVSSSPVSSSTVTSSTVTSSTVTPGAATSTTAGSAGAGTTAAPATQSKTYNLVGGWVRIAYGPGVVRLDGAGPSSGFTMDVRRSGPDRVEVRFTGGDHRSSFRVEWRDGRLDGEIEED